MRWNADCRIIGLALGLIACWAGGASGGTPVDVYVLSGQSNMVGSGSVAGLHAEHPELAHQEDVLYQFNMNVGQWVSEDWGALRELSALGPSFGLELAFGRAVADADPSRRVAIVKIAVNGSPIRRWVPGGAYWPTLESFTADALEGLESMGYTPTVRAFVWVQGASDANHSVHHAIYEDRLLELSSAVRDLWNSQLLIVQSQQFCCGPFPQNQIDAVRAAKSSFTALDSHATLSDTDDLEMRQDDIHYAWRGLLTLGERLAEAMLAHDPTDLNGDGAVDTADLGLLIHDFGASGMSRADLNLDGVVDTADLGDLLSSFGGG